MQQLLHKVGVFDHSQISASFVVTNNFLHVQFQKYRVTVGPGQEVILISFPDPVDIVFFRGWIRIPFYPVEVAGYCNLDTDRLER